MFSPSLGYGLRRLLRDCAVLSDARMAASELVAAALDEIALHVVRLPGRTLYVTRRAEVPAQDVLCGIATTTGDGPPELLPADERGADLVLAVARSRHQLARSRSVRQLVRAARRARRRIRRRRRMQAFSRALLAMVDGKLEVVLLALAVVFVGGVVAVALADGVSLWRAFYTTLITAADAGDPDETSPVRQVTHVLVVLAGLAMVPVLTAIATNTSEKRRPVPIAEHVVVIGLGNVGTQVIQLLHERGHDVVAIDLSESSRGAQLAETLGIPLVIGDASQEGALRRASVRTCRAVLALSTSDVVNLEAALHARNLRPGVPVVMRLFDDDFAARVEQAFDIPTSRSVSSLAAPAFAVALLEWEVIETIAVRRRVLLIAEVTVADGSVLDGQRLSDVAEVGQLRVIARTGYGDRWPTWTPPPDTPVRAGDRLYVVANRTGLSRVLARSTAPAP